MDAVSDRLRNAGAKPTTASKLELALGASASPQLEGSRLRRSATVKDLACASISAATMRLIAHDPAARLGDPEAIHQARVAIRRLRSDLKTLQPALDRRSSDRLRTELAWVGDALGAVRDLDVLIARAADRVSGWDEGDRLEVDRLLGRLRQRRDGALRRLRRTLASPRYARLVDRLIGASITPPMADPDERRNAKRFLRDRIRRAWRRTARFAKRLDERSAATDLHELRKRAKRARYAAELGADLFGADAERLAAALADVQDVLGGLQDTVVAEDEIRGQLASRTPCGRAFVAGRLIEAERAEGAERRSRWPIVWKRARRRRLHRWLH
jgi:CHAD domain-containing protein